MKYCNCHIVGQIVPVEYLDDRLIKMKQQSWCQHPPVCNAHWHEMRDNVGISLLGLVYTYHLTRGTFDLFDMF